MKIGRLQIPNALALLFGAAFVLAACAPGRAPSPRNVPRSQVYNASYDDVWNAAIDAVALRNLPINELEKDSGIISLEDVPYHPADADEGTFGSLERVIQRRGAANILVRSLAPNQTSAQINLRLAVYIQSGNGSIYYPYHNFWRDAVSKGTIEQRLLSDVAGRIGSGTAVPSPASVSSTTTQAAVTSPPVRSSNRWIGQGVRDGCGADWAMDLDVSGGTVRGKLWRGNVEYDVLGHLNSSGNLSDGRAAKSRKFTNVPGPRFLSIGIDFGTNPVEGFYEVNASGAKSCHTVVQLEPF